MMKKTRILFLALALCLVTMTALAASPADVLCPRCSVPCDEWYLVCEGGHQYHVPMHTVCHTTLLTEAQHCVPVSDTALCDTEEGCPVCNSEEYRNGLLPEGFVHTWCVECLNPIYPTAEEHVFSEWRPVGFSQHMRTCLTCEKVVEYGTHTGGSDICDADKICTLCNAVYAKGTEHDFRTTVVPPACHEDGYTVYDCRNCETIITADYVDGLKHWYGEWVANNDGTHTAACRREGCEYTQTLDCQNLSVVLDEKKHSVCPVCGAFGDEVFAVIKKAKISGSASRGEGAVLGMENPIKGVAYAFTVGWEYSGKQADFPKNAKVTIPWELGGGKLFVAEGENLVEVPFTLEGGVLTFTTSAPGLYLYRAE